MQSKEACDRMTRSQTLRAVRLHHAFRLNHRLIGELLSHYEIPRVAETNLALLLNDWKRRLTLRSTPSGRLVDFRDLRAYLTLSTSGISKSAQQGWANITEVHLMDTREFNGS
jgi:hypothetical protein